jgi:Zn-dependent peptidase ImmA (M78 family)
VRSNNDDSPPQGPGVGAARNAARKLLKDAGAGEIPVSLVKVIDHLKAKHRLDVIRHPFGDKTSGMLAVIDGQPTVGFNHDMAWVRRRFTIAHEIGHFLLGHECAGECGHGDVEVEANQFVAELLMPLAPLRADHRRTPDPDALAMLYIVSREAMFRRLMDCRML